MSEDRKSYAGYAQCGCLVAAMVAGIDTEKQEQRELLKWVKQGLRIEVVTSADVRADPTFLNCQHEARYEDPDAEVEKLVKAGRS